MEIPVLILWHLLDKYCNKTIIWVNLFKQLTIPYFLRIVIGLILGWIFFFLQKMGSGKGVYFGKRT